MALRRELLFTYLICFQVPTNPVPHLEMGMSGDLLATFINFLVGCLVCRQWRSIRCRIEMAQKLLGLVAQ
jgi:hypothetical protein